MIKSNMPNMPGMGAMTDTLEFVKNFWGSMGVPGTNAAASSMPGMNLPGMVMPTLSVEEIRKKITDLKTVESWLELNMNMLRASIQALEVQAATISTLHSMGQALSATVHAAAPAAPFSEAAPESRQAQPAAESAVPPPKATHKAADAPEPTGRDEADAASLTAPLMNAAAWWNMLQDQFKQAVNTAMAAETPAAKSGNGVDRTAPKKTKPRAATKASTRRKSPK